MGKGKKGKTLCSLHEKKRFIENLEPFNYKTFFFLIINKLFKRQVFFDIQVQSALKKGVCFNL